MTQTEKAPFGAFPVAFANMLDSRARINHISQCRVEMGSHSNFFPIKVNLDRKRPRHGYVGPLPSPVLLDAPASYNKGHCSGSDNFSPRGERMPLACGYQRTRCGADPQPSVWLNTRPVPAFFGGPIGLVLLTQTVARGVRDAAGSAWRCHRGEPCQSVRRSGWQAVEQNPASCRPSAQQNPRSQS